MYWRMRYAWRRVRLRLARIAARGPISVLIRGLLPLYIIIGLVAVGFIWARDHPGRVSSIGQEIGSTVERWGKSAERTFWDRLSSGIDGETGVELVRGFLPDLADQGQAEQASNHSWRTPARAWVFMLTGYDLSQPRTFLEASVPGLRQANQRRLDEIRLAQRKVPPTPPSPPSDPHPSDPQRQQPHGDLGPIVQEPPLPGDEVEPHISSDPVDRRGGPDAIPTALASVASRPWGEDPLVLIFHTHTSESYHSIPPNPLANETNHIFNSHDTGITRVGEALAMKLRQQYNIGTIHSKRIHDWPHHVMAYRNSRETVEELLERYPTIQLVLDLHRQGIPDFSFATSVGQYDTVSIEILYTTAENMRYGSHPDWRRNQSVAVRLSEFMEQTHPGLLRRVMRVDTARYNQDLHPHMLLLEVGNYLDLEEHAIVAAKLLADPIAQLLAEIVSKTRGRPVHVSRRLPPGRIVTPPVPERPSPLRLGPG